MEKTIYVWATDKFLSGWGHAEGKIHKQVAECPNWDEANRMLRGFEGDSSYKYVNWGYSDSELVCEPVHQDSQAEQRLYNLQVNGAAKRDRGLLP